MHHTHSRPAADPVRGGTKLAARGSIALEPSGPAQPQTRRARGWLGLVLVLAITAVAAALYAAGPAIIPVAWLAVGPLLASLVLSLFIPGVGTMAAGRVWEGLLILGCYILAGLLCLVLVGFILVPTVWIWGMWDAYKAAQKWNAAHGIIS